MTKIVYLFVLLLTLACAQKKKPQHYQADTYFHPKAKVATFTESHPVLCFDEAHHNLAVEEGNYRAVLELATSDGYNVAHIKDPFTDLNLRDCKILYISAVLGHVDYHQKELAKRSAFSDEEIKSIKNWVSIGGSLLVATDHRPMSNAASKLLKEFNVKGSIINVRNERKMISPFSDPGIFSIDESQMNLKSPIIMGRNESERLKLIYIFYGEALQGPADADIFLRIGEGALIGGEENDEIIAPSEYPAAALALKFEKGRLVVFGDGTVFTSKIDLDSNEKTGLNKEGSDNIQMALNVLHWLSGTLK